MLFRSGTRKVLATGSSGLLEMVSRGFLGGVKRTNQSEKKDAKKVEYDRTKATDLIKAWDDVVEGLVYGGLVDEMFDQFSKTSDVESHSPVIGAAAEYAIIQYVLLCRSPTTIANPITAWQLSSTTSSSSPLKANIFSNF